MGFAIQYGLIQLEIKKTDLVRLEIQEINLVPVEKLIDEMTQGIYKWQSLNFAIMDKYEKIIKDKDNNPIVCFDVSTSEFYQHIANYLKKSICK